MLIANLTSVPPPNRRNELYDKLLHRTAVIGVIGLGYVGLPLAVEKTKVGFAVIGFDRNAQRVDAVNAGRNYVKDVRDAELASAASAGRIQATTDVSRLAECDVIVICVPTPLTVNRDPDISYIKSVAEQVARTLRPGQLVCLESTTYPGTTEDVIAPILSAGGLVVGEDFFLAFSPERVDPGNRRYSTRNTNKVVGGMTSACLEVAAHFYQQTIVDVVTVSSPRVAEMTKVFENTFRSVNIALVNELTLLCDKMDISVWEVIDAAATKPFGIMRFDPGPGVGGHCIPIDPFYLAWKAKQYDFNTKFIELAGEINRSMPYFVLSKVVRALNSRGIALSRAQILLVGVAYKRNVEDWRESPAIKILELLQAEGAAVEYHDALVPQIVDSQGRAHASVSLDAERLRSAQCTIALVDHADTDWPFIVANSQLVVDTRNATADVPDRSNVVLL